TTRRSERRAIGTRAGRIDLRRGLRPPHRPGPPGLQRKVTMSIKGKGRPARAGIVACLSTVAAVLLLPGAAQASSQDKFEKQFVSYLSEMGKVAASLEATPAGNAAFDQLGMDPARGTARARLEVKSMSSAELAVLRQAFSTIPGWRDQPD